MIGINQFEEIMAAVQKHEELLNALWETKCFSLECPLQDIVYTILNALADDFTESATKEIEGIDIGEVIFNWCYEHEFGTKYSNVFGDGESLVTVSHVEYTPKDARELYEVIMLLTQKKAEESNEKGN